MCADRSHFYCLVRGVRIRRRVESKGVASCTCTAVVVIFLECLRINSSNGGIGRGVRYGRETGRGMVELHTGIEVEVQGASFVFIFGLFLSVCLSVCTGWLAGWL